MTLPDPFHRLAFDVLDSTNREANDQALGGAPHGLVITAVHQSQGRGRSGRTWVSEPGNLFASLILRPNKPLTEAAKMSFVLGLAIAGAIQELLPDAEVQCKWPNDILVGGAKISGLLLESAPVEPSAMIPDYLIAGFGVNIQNSPKDTAWPATSFKDQGVTTTADIVLERICHHLIHWQNTIDTAGFSAIRNAWLSKAWGLGQSITVRTVSEDIEGLFENLDETGALVLLTPKETRHIHAGDVFFQDLAKED